MRAKTSFFKAIQKTTRKQLTICLFIILAIFGAKELFAEHYGFSLNPTKSLEGRLFFYKKSSVFKAKKGDLLAFKLSHNDQYYPNQILVKIVAGVEGEAFDVDGKSYVIGDSKIKAKEYSNTGEKLNQFSPPSLIIPKDSYFVVGTNPNSYDSRYVGFINQSQVVGRVWVLF